MADDRALVARAKTGDQAAFAELVTTHERRIYNLAYRMLNDPDEARDACQDAFVTAYRRLDSFRGEAAFSTWLYRVAINACHDILRVRKRTPMPSEIDERTASGFDVAESTSVSIDVQRALALVPDEFRAALVLHDMHDLAYEDIAATLDIPVGTAKSRVHRGRVALGHLLAGTEPAARASEGT